ncbi:MAG TPA: hypothetical protein VMP01_03405 [Pirellulaceae bacterium]|nr:hypothetical protein [Pirellulaceae bacterium]
MFGKPAWFRPKLIGWGLKPVTWQGWAYTAAWAGVLLLPFWALLMRHQPLEALTWLGCGIGVLFYDAAQIRRGMIPPVAVAANAPAQANDGVWFLGDEVAKPVATRNFDLKLKR